MGRSDKLLSKASGAGGFGAFFNGLYITALHSDGSRVCAGTAAHGLYSSTDSGAGFTLDHDADWLGDSFTYPVTAVFCGASRTYVGTSVGLFIRDETDQSWSSYTYTSAMSPRVRGIFEVGDHVYITTSSSNSGGLLQGALWISTDGGDTFEVFGHGEGLPYYGPHSATEGTIDLTRILVHQGALFVGSLGGLLKTVDL